MKIKSQSLEVPTSVIMPILTTKSNTLKFLQTSGPENRVDPKKFENTDWLFPETTKNFNKLPLQYRVSMSHILEKL